MRGLSLIIPTYNRAELLQGALTSLVGMELPTAMDWEILVVDNNCTDETPTIIDRMKAHLPVRRVLEPQQGLCFARNRAIQEAAYEHLVYLDDDITVATTWLRGYTQAIDEWNADAVVGPVNPVYPDFIPSYATQRVLRIISSTYSQKGPVPMLLPREKSHEISGCNFGIRKSLVVELGGFDPRLDRIGSGMLSGGDWELGWRLAKAGKRVVYHPDCSIRHLISPGKLTRSYLRRRAFGDGVSGAVISAKHGTPVSVIRQLRMAVRTFRSFAQVVVSVLRQDAGAVMEHEIEACGNAGIAIGPLIHRYARVWPSGQSDEPPVLKRL